MASGWRGLALSVVLLLGCGLAAAIGVQTAAASSVADLRVAVGMSGFYRESAWTPLRVTVHGRRDGAGRWPWNLAATGISSPSRACRWR